MAKTMAPTDLPSKELEHPAFTLALNCATREQLIETIRQLYTEREQLKQRAAHEPPVEPDGYIRWSSWNPGGPEPEQRFEYEFKSRDEQRDGDGWVPLYSRPSPPPTNEPASDRPLRAYDVARAFDSPAGSPPRPRHCEKCSGCRECCVMASSRAHPCECACHALGE